MNKYHNGKIYKIITDNSDKIYIGSCCMDLRKRLYDHKQNKKKCSSDIIINLGNYDIILIEKYPCEDNEELRMREQYWIDYYKNNGFNIVNIRNSYLSHEDKKNHYKNYFKIYYEKNKDKIKSNEKDKRNNIENKLYQREYHKDLNMWKSKKRLKLICEFIDILNMY